MVNIWDAFGEDGDFVYNGGSLGAGFTVITSPDNAYRPSIARCGIQVNAPTAYLTRIWPQGPQQSGWAGARVAAGNASGGTNGCTVFGLTDTNGVLRISVYNATGSAVGPFNVYKVDETGAQTLLFATTSGLTNDAMSPDKIDINYNYAINGGLTLYINAIAVGSYAGDITTDGITTLGGSYYGPATGNGASAPTTPATWSECIVSLNNTTTITLVTNAPIAPGTLQQWTGAYSNVNEVVVNDANFDTVNIANLTQRYLMGEIVLLTGVIAGIVTNIRGTQGGSAIARVELAELIAETAALSYSQELPPALGPVQFIEEQNPVSGAAWTLIDLAAANREKGYFSVI